MTWKRERIAVSGSAEIPSSLAGRRCGQGLDLPERIHR